jgi:hypothetical protein
MLAALCGKLANSQRVEPAIANEARALYQEWNTIISRYGAPNSTATLNEQMEAQSRDLGIHMLTLLEKCVAV